MITLWTDLPDGTGTDTSAVGTDEDMAPALSDALVQVQVVMRSRIPVRPIWDADDLALAAYHTAPTATLPICANPM